MFPGSDSRTSRYRLLGILSYVWVCRKSKMAAINRNCASQNAEWRILRIISSFGVNHAQFADNTQYTSRSRTTTLHQGFQNAFVQFNIGSISTACQWTHIRPKPLLSAPAHEHGWKALSTVDLGCVRVSPVSNVRSLGVTIDDTLSFNEHVDNDCKSCNFHILALRHIRRHILEDAAKTIACSMVNGLLQISVTPYVRRPPTSISYSGYKTLLPV